MPGPATLEVLRAQSHDTPVISTALARAFQDDPVFTWLVPEAAERQARLPVVFAAFTDAFVPYEETYVAGAGAGAALWAPPDTDPTGGEHAEAFGERLGAALEAFAERAGLLGELLEAHHPAEPSFYLQFVGVVPEHQGTGVGGRLLSTVLRRCDANGTPAYLEATSERNRRLYERHGFRITGEIQLPDGPPLWPMWRDPAT